MSSTDWKLKTLLLWHLPIAFLIGSFAWAPTREWWDSIDASFFHFWNGSLEGRPAWQTFWALANHRMADWVEDVCILAFFIAHLAKSHKELRRRKRAELLFCVFYLACVIYFVNRLLFRSYIHIPRDSPTLFFDSSILLSEKIDWLSIKDISIKSFPADHATTALLFAGSFSYFASWRMGMAAFLYAAFLCLPRLVTGAHWLSDVVVGSGCISIFFLSWAFCTPLHKKLTDLFEWLLSLPSRLRRRAEG